MNTEIINYWYCKSEVHYKHLMKKLEERGWKWADGRLPTEKDLYAFVRSLGCGEGVIISGYGNKELGLTFPQGNIVFESLKDKAIKVELPRPKIVKWPEQTQFYLNGKEMSARAVDLRLEQAVTHIGNVLQSITDGTDAIKPSHYQGGSGDLFDEWFNRYDLATFRALMYGTAERYFRRYPDKNGKEDFKKGQEVLRRLEEYEAKAGEVKGWKKA